MDVKTSDNEGIDAMCVIMNNNNSNEKSLKQGFTSGGNNLDNLFLTKKDNEAVNLYMDSYKDEINKAIENKKLENLYIIAFISSKNKIYLTCFKLNIKNVKYVKSDGFTKQLKSINVKNFIDDKYGNVKLYKSKKRLELRLNINCITNSYSQLLFSNETNLSDNNLTTGTDIALPANL